MGTIFLVSLIFNCTYLRVSRSLLSLANYSVTKFLRKIRATNFMEKIRKITH